MPDTQQQKPKKAVIWAAVLVLACLIVLGAYFFSRLQDNPAGKTEVKATALAAQDSALPQISYSVKIANGDLSLFPGETTRLSCVTEPQDADAAWQSENTEVVSVDGGLLTAHAPGSAVIHVFAFGGAAEDSIRVTVKEKPVESVVLTPDSTTLLSGETALLQAETLPADAADTVLVWNSSNPLVARVDQTGAIMAWAEGETQVTATAENGITSAATIAVEGGPPLPGNVSPARYKYEDGVYLRKDGTQSEKAVVLLTGDLMCLGAQISVAGSGGTYNFDGSFAQVKNIFAQADFAAGNLETAVSYDSPYTVSGAPGLPVLNAPMSYLTALRNAGLDGFSSVNNHCCDIGAKGIIQTIDALDAYGFAHTGTFSAPDADRFFIANVNGIKVGFLAYSEFYNGKDGLLTEEERAYMINPFSEERAKEDIAALKDAGAEFVIAYIHWGNENQPLPAESQRQHAQQLADAGADVIAGSHPHCLQPAAYIDSTDGRRVLCFYSLGNFVSSMASTANNDTVIARLELEQTGSGASLESASYYPCRVAANGGAPFVVLPVTQADGACQRIAQSIGDEIPALPVP